MLVKLNAYKINVIRRMFKIIIFLLIFQFTQGTYPRYREYWRPDGTRSDLFKIDPALKPGDVITLNQHMGLIHGSRVEYFFQEFNCTLIACCDILFYIDLQATNSVFRINYLENGLWGYEIRDDYKVFFWPGEYFKVQINVGTDYFDIFVNGKYATQFYYPGGLESLRHMKYLWIKQVHLMEWY